jgi:hypothetical protein
MCKFYKFLYWMIPVKSFRSYLIKKHFAACSRCQREVEKESHLKELLAVPNWIETEKSLWPQIKQKILVPEEKVIRIESKHESFFRRKWSWAMVGFVFAGVVGLGLLVRQSYLKRTPEERILEIDKPRITIKHAEIKGKKAKPYIYQTPYVSFIWFAEIKNSGG